MIDRWLSLTPIERAAALPDLQKVLRRIYPGQLKAEPQYEEHAGRLAVLSATAELVDAAER